MAAVTIAVEITREAMRFGVDVGDVVFEDHDVLIGDFLIRAQATEFRTTILTMNRSEDKHCYRNGYESKHGKRFLHKTSSEIVAGCKLGATTNWEEQRLGGVWIWVGR
jgi:hypothetical protein